MTCKPLQVEFDYYISHQYEFIKKYNGKVVVIVGHEVVGCYDSDGEAIDETSKAYKLGTFLIQKCGPGEEHYTCTIHSPRFIA